MLRLTGYMSSAMRHPLHSLLANRERERERLRRALADIEHEIATYRDALRSLGLPPASNPQHTDPVAAASIGMGRTGRPVLHKHPFTLALKKRGSSLSAWAEAHSIPRPTVQAWVLPPPDQRPIPMEFAKEIEREFVDENGESLVPLSVWGDKIR